MRKALAIVAVGCGCAVGPPALADWVKIGNGPSLKVAEAYCENAAMGAPQDGYFIMGSPMQVGMGQMGHAIGGAIRREKYKKNCMVLLGWEKRRGKKDKPQFNASGKN